MTKLISKPSKYGIYIISTIILLSIFLIHGENVWGEVIIEYLPHATGSAMSSDSLAGYLTIFPILIAKSYYFLFNGKIISWPFFANSISYFFALLNVLIIIKIGKDNDLKNKIIFFILLPLFILLIHPSVSSFINITHIGYLPLLFYIVININQEDFNEKISNIPYYVFIPYIISTFSKPSLVFIPIILILLFSKIYKHKLKFLILLLCSFFSIYQTFLFRSAASNFALSTITGFFNFVIALFQTLGGLVLFDFHFYKMTWSSLDYKIYVILCLGLGIIVFSLVVFILKRDRKFMDFWERFLILGSIGFIFLFPFVSVNCNLNINSVLKLNLINIFSKYKLQRQLTGCFIVMVFIVIVLMEIKNKKFRTFAYILLFILLLNGVCTSLYASMWPSVNSLKGIEYNFNNAYLYAPYVEWDLNWNSEAIGWYWKDPDKIIKKYRKIVVEPYVAFRKRNRNISIEELKAIENGKIYLLVIDENINIKGEMNYLNGLINHNKREIGEINFKNQILEVKFTKASYNSIRYAVIEYNYELYDTILKDELDLKINGNFINNDNINGIVIYQ